MKMFTKSEKLDVTFSAITFGKDRHGFDTKLNGRISRKSEELAENCVQRRGPALSARTGLQRAVKSTMDVASKTP